MKAKALLFLFACVALSLLGQTSGDYRTKATGNWNAWTITWETFNGTAWVDATQTPTNANANVITVRNGHTVTVTANVSIDQTVIEAGGAVVASSGTLTIANGTGTDLTVYGTLEKINNITTTGTVVIGNGGKYVHNKNGDSLIQATWDNGSTCELTGLTTSQPGNRDQNLYNFTWNCPGQTGNENTTGANFLDFRGKLKVISTGSGSWTWTDSANTSKNIKDYEQTGGTVYMTQGGGDGIVNLTGDFIMSGGLLSETGGSTACAWNFNKAGTQLFNKTGGTISEVVSFTVNSGSTVDVVAQPFTGAGNFTLNSGGGLIIRDAAGITTSGASGAVQVTGTRTYNAAANYYYTGSVAQATGNGLTTANNLTIDNAAGVTLTNSVTVNGTLYQVAGSLSGTIATDGYDSAYIDIAESAENLAAFSASSATISPDNPDMYVDRSWSISSSTSTEKNVTFYWDTTDDNTYPWSATDPPAVFINGVKQTTVTWSEANPRQITISMSSFSGSAVIRVGRDNEQPLPVVLSAFNVMISGSNNVLLAWVTQSETGMLGFYVFRSQSEELAAATIVSPLIAASNTTQQQFYVFTDDDLTASGTYYYWLQSLDLDGGFSYHGPVAIYYNANGSYESPDVPVFTELNPIYPNPFNPRAYIPYSLDRVENVDFRIYNARGQQVREFRLGETIPGNHRLEWDGTDASGRVLPNGVYFFRMTAGKDSFQRKAVLLK